MQLISNAPLQFSQTGDDLLAGVEVKHLNIITLISIYITYIFNMVLYQIVRPGIEQFVFTPID